MKKALLFCIFIISIAVAKAQSDTLFLPPFKFAHLLSGNFGELRSNHFHGGLDFKTQGAVGKQIYAPADGYISRASVSAGGYGNAIYVTHTDGYMTVYGHLQKLPSGVAERVRKEQYEKECFAVDLTFAPDEFPVKKGVPLALAGNSGYSFGPHLHFEVRRNNGDELVNPMLFYKELVKDTRAPKALSLLVKPLEGRGLVNGEAKGVKRAVNGALLADTIDAWGVIGIAVKAQDHMDNTSNKYGVYSIDMLVDDELHFSSRMDYVAFSENRLINAWVDYAEYIENGEWFQRAYILPNNPLRILSANDNGGRVIVDEERCYNVLLRLTDYHGNSSDVRCVLRGKRGEPANRAMQGDNAYMLWFMNNSVERDYMRLAVPSGALFENTTLNISKSQGSVSASCCIAPAGVYFWNGAELSLRVENDTFPSHQYFIKKKGKKNYSCIGAKYSDGRVTANINSSGIYEVGVDSVAPQLKPVDKARWARNGAIKFTLVDKEGVVKSYRGEIDGEFILFEYSSKNGVLTCNLKREGVKRGKHLLRVVAIDGVGNETVFEENFVY